MKKRQRKKNLKLYARCAIGLGEASEYAKLLKIGLNRMIFSTIELAYQWERIYARAYQPVLQVRCPEHAKIYGTEASVMIVDDLEVPAREEK